MGKFFENPKFFRTTYASIKPNGPEIDKLSLSASRENCKRKSRNGLKSNYVLNEINRSHNMEIVPAISRSREINIEFVKNINNNLQISKFVVCME